MKAKEHIQENKATYIIASVFTAIIGGSVVVDLPNVTVGADKKVEELKIEVTQVYEQRERQWEQQRQYHTTKEIEEIRWRMRYISDQVNRINQIPVYLKRDLTAQEIWQLEQLKQEFRLLQEKLSTLR